jgi:hypothetical protein
MSSATPSAERREQMLGLLAEKTLALACAVQARALEAESADEMAKLSGAFARLSRSVRQSIALHARLEGDRLRPAPAAPAPAQPAPAAAPSEPEDPHRLAVRRRRAMITRAVERCVWNEYDDEDEDEEATACSLLKDFDDRLADLAEDDAFLDADPDRLIAQFCAELGLEPPPVRPRATLAAAIPSGAEPPSEGAGPTPDPRTLHSPDSS